MEDLLVCLFEALKTERPNFSSVLVMDEMNSPGVTNCNIELVNGMMRYIYQQKLGISLYVVTQNKAVGQALCALNFWQRLDRWKDSQVPPVPRYWKIGKTCHRQTRTFGIRTISPGRDMNSQGVCWESIQTCKPMKMG
jgi:hypothetical protein